MHWSTKKWNSLTKEQQEILQEASELAKEYSREASDARISERISVIEGSGTQIVSLSEDVRKEMVERSQSVYDEIRENVDSRIVEKYLGNVGE